MVFGIGVDCVAVERIEKSMRKENFQRRVFSAGERAYLEGRGANAAQSAAGCFAAKEAFLKAIGTGLGGFALEELAVGHRDSRAPYYAFTGKAAAYMEQEGLAAHLSISHDGGMAMAFCVLEKVEKGCIK